MDVARVWRAPENLGFPFNIYIMVETNDFKFGTTQLGFANYAHRKVTAWFSYIFPFNIFAMAEVAMDVPNKRY